jgi:hypothetical protein
MVTRQYGGPWTDAARTSRLGTARNLGFRLREHG